MTALVDNAPDYGRRFGGIGRLYTPEGAQKIQSCPFTVIGLGGVGSWVAEALTRTGATDITLIDLDNVAESNTNRQIQAVDGNYGKPKVDALRERIRMINPLAEVRTVEDFVDAENAADIIPAQGVVIDCIDNVIAKAAIISVCVRRKQCVVTCGAAGGRKDPTRITFGDLAMATGDPLLSRVRARLRREYGFPKLSEKGKAKTFGVTAIYSDEPIQRPSAACEMQTQGGLACAGYGSAVVVTAALGLVAASVVLNALTKD